MRSRPHDVHQIRHRNALVNEPTPPLSTGYLPRCIGDPTESDIISNGDMFNKHPTRRRDMSKARRGSPSRSGVESATRVPHPSHLRVARVCIFTPVSPGPRCAAAGPANEIETLNGQPRISGKRPIDNPP